MADTDLAQLVINIGTQAQIESGISGGTITSDMLSIATDGYTIESMLEALYPVGSIYITTANTCPLSTLIAGSTWTQIKDRFIVGAGDTYTLGDTGGSRTNTHNHIQTVGADDSRAYILTNVDSAVPTSTVYNNDSTNTGKYINFTGTRTSVRLNATENRTISIEPPYLVVNIFQRTA